MRLIPILASLVALATSALAAPRPNLLFILADDLGWSDLSCYGAPFDDTPHLDRFAREGLRFTQAYTAGSVCSPTRGSLMTGKYPPRTGVTDYIPGLSSAGHKLAAPRTKTELALAEVTIAEALKAGGYQTFYTGKWHLGGRGFEPQDQGFEVTIPDAQLGNAGSDWQVGKRLTESAVKFLDERDPARPFFMFLGYHEPHTPILEYPDHIDKFRAKAAKLPANRLRTRRERDGMTRIAQDDPAYGSEVAGLDAFVGTVLAKLEQKGLAKSTIVIFFSDNGGLSTKATPGPASNEPLRAGKGWLYEGGIRVPLMVRAPGITTAGATTDAPVISTDFYPTLLELAGLPARPEQHRDGVSITSILRGAAPPPRDTFFWHYPHYHGSTWAPGGAMRQGDWKLIEFFEDNSAELYNLRTDLHERQNLAAAEPARVAAMRTELAAWRVATGAVMPQPADPSSVDPKTGSKKKGKNRKKVEDD